MAATCLNVLKFPFSFISFASAAGKTGAATAELKTEKHFLQNPTDLLQASFGEWPS